MTDGDRSEVSYGSDTRLTEKGRRIKRGPTSLYMDIGLWQEVKIMAVLKGKSVTDYVERALRKQIDEDNREVGRQGYKVGQGGMYIPPAPAPEEMVARAAIDKGEEIFDKDNLVSDEYGDLHLWAPGLKFPKTTQELIRFVERF